MGIQASLNQPNRVNDFENTEVKSKFFFIKAVLQPQGIRKGTGNNQARIESRMSQDRNIKYITVDGPLKLQ